MKNMLPIKRLILMQGSPASGKSWIARAIQEAPSLTGYIVSADYYFTDAEGNYKFKPDELHTAHMIAQYQCEELMKRGEETIIVDNTNIKKRDIRKYVILANTYGYFIQVVRVQCERKLQELQQAERNARKPIPKEVIEEMNAKIQDLL